MSKTDKIYSVEWEPEGFLVKFNGSVIVDDILDANGEVYGDNRFDGMKYSIWDFTDSILSGIEKEDMMTFVGEDLGATYVVNEHKLAIIVKDPHGVNIMTFYIKKSIQNGSSWEFSTHESESSARDWINT